MAEITLIRYRLEPGGAERVREWATEVRSRRSEAIETLQHGGVVSEAAFLESHPDGDYVCFYVEAESLDRAREAFESSPYEIDREFRELLAAVVADDQPTAEIEPLYHLTNPTRT